MKKLLIGIFLLLMGNLCVSLTAQNLVPVTTSDISSWTVKDISGATVMAVDVSECVNKDSLIEATCGAWYPKAQAPVCGSSKGVPASAIWGEGQLANAPCSFAAGVYFFSKTIQINPNQRVKHIDWQIIADNHFVVRVNGIVLTAFGILYPSSMGGTDWETRYRITDSVAQWTDYQSSTWFGSSPLENAVGNPIDLRNYFHQGTNTIEVEVQNLPSGVCANYAFFSMCGHVELEETTSLSDDLPSLMVKAFPNPTADHISLDLGQQVREVEVSVWNVLGQQLDSHASDRAESIEFPLPEAAGMYILQVKAKGKKTTSIRVWKE